MLKNIYHGSENIIKNPTFGKGSQFNDYGLAFYTTEDINLAKEWAVEKNRDGYVNHYELDMSGLSVLDLSSQEYNILHWLAILVDNRVFDIQTDFGPEAKNYLKENFLLDYKNYDVIIGYRADDSYFSFAQDFLNNIISVRTLSKAMYLGGLGKQIAIKSEKAFNRLKFIEKSSAKSVEWYPKKEKRDSSARHQYAALRNESWKRGEVYMMTIMDEEMKPDDARLRPDITC